MHQGSWQQLVITSCSAWLWQLQNSWQPTTQCVMFLPLRRRRTDMKLHPARPAGVLALYPHAYSQHQAYVAATLELRLDQAPVPAAAMGMNCVRGPEQSHHLPRL